MITEARGAELTISRIRTVPWRRFYRAGILAVDVIAPLAVITARWSADLVALVLLVLWPASLAAAGAYSGRFLAVAREELRRVALAVLGLLALAAITSYLLGALVGREVLLTAAVLLPLSALLGRLAVRGWLTRQRMAGHYLPRILVVGRACDVREVSAQVEHPRSGLGTVVGAVVPDESEAQPLFHGPMTVVSGLERARAAVDLAGADTVVIAGRGLSPEAVRRLAWSLEDAPAELIVSPGLADIDPHRVTVQSVAGSPLLVIARPRFRGSSRVVKALVDRGGAAALLLLLVPLFLGIALLVRFSSPGPALFRQIRIGIGGRPFTLYKFRTMAAEAEHQRPHLLTLNDTDGPLFKLRNDPRVTSVGRFLRRYSMDELPQLVNVLRGEMSLVGPRPPLPSEVADYPEHVRRRLLVKPGLTGLWQVSGRSNLSWEDTVRLDLRYVDNWSLAHDAAILGRTVHAVVRGTGAY